MASPELRQENKDKHPRPFRMAVRGVTAGAVILSTFLAPAFLNNSPLENSQTAFADWRDRDNNDNDSRRRHGNYNDNFSRNDNDGPVADWEKDRNHNGNGDQWDGDTGRRRCLYEKGGMLGERRNEDWERVEVCAIDIVDIPDRVRANLFWARQQCKDMGLSYVVLKYSNAVCAGNVRKIG